MPTRTRAYVNSEKVFDRRLTARGSMRPGVVTHTLFGDQHHGDRGAFIVIAAAAVLVPGNPLLPGVLIA